MPKATAVVATIQETLLAFLLSPLKQKQYQARGQKAVGNTARNACAATASQVLIDLAIIPKAETWAETLVEKLKATGRFQGSANRKDVRPADLVVCVDLDGPHGPDGNDDSDHVWWVLADLKATHGLGWYLCFDNQGKPHPRRLDGADGKTPMRGRLRLVK